MVTAATAVVTDWRLATRLLTGWDLAIALYLGLAFHLMGSAGVQRIAALAGELLRRPRHRGVLLAAAAAVQAGLEERH